ncbi:MAG: ABC transporter ATP-binding protein [Gammaproteobacteria bacterium]|nr:ABC transporter ATP-binding protein [Gammaproteobacteria bacterium]
MDASTLTQAKLEIRGLVKEFTRPKQAPLRVLDGIELTVRENEFVVFVGASGCGKSTLLRVIAGLEPATDGRALLDGHPIEGPGADRGMVFQHYTLYPWLTVFDNLRFSRSLKKNRRSVTTIGQLGTIVDRGYALLELMGLAAYKDAYPSQLSGGMQQRVAIARALLSSPKILLMDEPFGALDAQTREVMHDLILHLFMVERTTVLFVTHDVDEAIYLADRVVVMAPRPGRIDSIHVVPLPPERNADMKLAPEFLELKRKILHRIRETTGVQTNQELLRRLSGLKRAQS